MSLKWNACFFLSRVHLKNLVVPLGVPLACVAFRCFSLLCVLEYRVYFVVCCVANLRCDSIAINEGKKSPTIVGIIFGVEIARRVCLAKGEGEARDEKKNLIKHKEQTEGEPCMSEIK